MSVKVKVHDVLHERSNYTPSNVEDYILRSINNDMVSDIRIAPGNENSPIYITLESNSAFSNKSIKKVVRDVVKCFSVKFDGVDVDKTVRDSNIMIQTE